jgi:transcriptional regulator with XRE-family HTH domain
MKQASAPAIGEAIRYLREEQGLSQSELARRSRLTQATISRIESGSRRGDIETLALLAAGLGLALWILVKRAEGIRLMFHARASGLFGFHI